MTWKELKERFSDAKKAEWHQHKNGGGWVQNTAAVDDSAYVGPRAIIYGEARVYGSARVYGDARVYGSAEVSGDAAVSGSAMVYGNAMVYGSAEVSGDAAVSGSAMVYGNAMVYGSARVSRGRYLSSPLYIQGSSYPVTHNGGEWVYIGCELHTISEWRGKIGRDLAVNEEFTPAQISEYRDYLNLIARRVIIDPDNDYNTADKSKTREITRLRAANSALHRRCQGAEGAVAQKAEKQGPSLGRALANAQAERLRAENERLREVLAEITILIDKHDKQEADDE